MRSLPSITQITYKYECCALFKCLYADFSFLPQRIGVHKQKSQMKLKRGPKKTEAGCAIRNEIQMKHVDSSGLKKSAQPTKVCVMQLTAHTLDLSEKLCFDFDISFQSTFSTCKLLHVINTLILLSLLFELLFSAMYIIYFKITMLFLFGRLGFVPWKMCHCQAKISPTH